MRQLRRIALVVEQLHETRTRDPIVYRRVFIEPPNDNNFDNGQILAYFCENKKRTEMEKEEKKKPVASRGGKARVNSDETFSPAFRAALPL